MDSQIDYNSLQFERDFNDEEEPHCFFFYWKNGIWISLVYLTVIFAIQSGMKNARQLNLRPWLILWNFILGVFSTIGFIRSLPVFYTFVYTQGIFDFIFSKYQKTGIKAFWVYAYCFSKLFEFVDTLFIVLRKRNLIFLHWYHHCATLIFTWYGYTHFFGLTYLPMVMNYGVHSVMYMYYMLRAMHVQVPRYISMSITVLQIIQMVIGLALMCFSYTYIDMSYETSDNILKISIVGILMYSSYMVLFVRYFIKAYLEPHKKKLD